MQAGKADTQQRVQFRAASCRGHLVWVERVRALHRGVSVYRPTGSSSGAETEKPVGSAERDTKVRHSSTGCEQVQNIAHLRTVSGTAIIDNESSNQGSLMIGGRMSRKPNSIGQFAVRVIEDARIDLLSSLLLLRENETEPDFGLPDEVPDHADFDAACEFRKEVIEALSQFDSDDLRPIENRCRRVKTLADGKGISSLDTIAEKHFDDEWLQEFKIQPDPLCRSIWAYLKARRAFEDAESFYYARQFRDYGKMYDAFEVELEKVVAVNAATIDEVALATQITKVLELKTACTVKALDLPATSAHPASIMLIVRHGGPLSSVYDHKADGRRSTIYFRPPNEATLIYTPSSRQIEVCADSAFVRQQISGAFAEVALGHDVSRKPLTWKRYNLTRFRTGLSLPVPVITGYDISLARVLEAEVRLGTWSRKLSLKVSIDDDIEEVANRHLGANNVFKRAEEFSKIGIAVAYSKEGDGRARTLNITIAGSKSCNLQSNKDPEERSFGYSLLDAWGIMTAFRQIENGDLRAIFSQLVELYDRVDEQVSGSRLREMGLDPERLIEGGLLERRGRQAVILDEDDGIEGEFRLQPSPTLSMLQTVGPFGQSGGTLPTQDLQMYVVNKEWLHETILRLLKPLLHKRASVVVDDDLTLLGSMQIDAAEVPLYFARRLDDLKTISHLDVVLRAKNSAGVGIVLCASPEMPAYLGPNVVVPILSNLSPSGEELVIAREGLELAYKSNLTLARGGALPQVLRSGTQSATLHIPGKDPLTLTGADQVVIFERLVKAHNAGSPDVQVKALMDGFGSRSPQNAFRSGTWKSIIDAYITKGAKNGYWRLMTEVIQAA